MKSKKLNEVRIVKSNVAESVSSIVQLAIFRPSSSS